jgi:hypothetical protein
LIRINGDFKICESPDMLDRLKIGLGFLTISEIQVLQKIGAANFSIVLEFLKHEGIHFELSLESACERAARDPIVSEILFKLQSVYPLLVLFCSNQQAKLSTFFEMEQHLSFYAKETENDDENNSETLTSLKEILENFPDVQDYFVEDSDGRNDDIVGKATKYLAGKYISRLSASSHGASLTLTYGRKIIKEVDERRLQDHMQWAKLCKTMSMNVTGETENHILDSFVSSLMYAQSVHALRLKLESSGHPDFQGLDGALLTTGYDDVSLTTTQASNVVSKLCDLRIMLQNEFAKWDDELEKVTCTCPRLRLLNFRSRVQLLRALKLLVVIDEMNEKVKVILPYIIQCFPSILRQRNLITNELSTVFNEELLMNIIELDAVETLTQLKRLLFRLEKHFHVDNYLSSNASDGVENYEPVRIDVQETFQVHGAISLYANHVADMLSCNLMAGVPGMVVWCDANTTEIQLVDFAIVARSGLCATMHVIGVDKLLPRIREVLLRALQQEPLRCPVSRFFKLRKTFGVQKTKKVRITI